MSSTDKRLDRLYPALSARERAIALLRDYKERRPQDPWLLHSAPDGQTPELNRLIGMVNAANGDLAHVVAVLAERAVQLELRFSWLEWARICALEMWAVRAYFDVSGREPITESAYREREAAARAELIPVEECATIYTEDFHAWDDADYEADEEGEWSPSDEAWYRVRDEKLQELRALVAAGTLKASGRGRNLKVECGAFYDWLGAPVPVVPELGAAFDVRPDSRATEVERARRDHALIREILDRGACKLDLPLDVESPLVLDAPEGGFGVELARVLAVSLRTGISETWRELRAIEEQLESFRAAFDGEDVLIPRARQTFDRAKATLVGLQEKLQAYTGPFELPAPDDEVRALVRKIADREVAG